MARRKISVDEAMAMFEESEKAGLVHTWPFAASSRLNEICNCCVDCCANFHAGLDSGTIGQILEKSQLRTEVDQDHCNFCQDCVERCFSGAVEMKKSPSA